MLPSSMSLEHQQRISTACRICRSSDFTIVCTEEDIAAQHRYLEQFHQRRLAAQGTTRRQSNILSDRVTFTHNYKTDIVVCRDCGLAFRNPHPTAGAIAKAYAVEQYEKAHLLSEFSAQLAWARRKASMLGRLLSKQTTPQLVEVGSFVGGFLAAAKEQGWNILGVDPGEAVTRFCLDRRLPIFQGTIEQAPVSCGQLDAVVIWNTSINCLIHGLRWRRSVARSDLTACSSSGSPMERVSEPPCLSHDSLGRYGTSSMRPSPGTTFSVFLISMGMESLRLIV